MRRLPPLNALRAFEAAVRTGSHADAALLLGVTPGAVGQQIATLEHWLGHALFTKEGRRMVATPMARVFAAEVGLSLDRLALAADAYGRPGVRRILRVSAPTTLAMRWLIPRLPRYHAAHPDVEVVVTTVSSLVEDLRGGVDVAIRRGVARQDLWPQHHVVPLLDDVDTVIMSPDLFSRRPIRVPADVDGHAWLASETRVGDWDNWLAAAGLQHLAGRPRQTFDHFFVTRQAVVDGLGIGIGPLPLLEIDIARGNLMMPLPELRVPRTGYIALHPRQADPARLLSGFVDWLAGEASRSGGAVPASAMQHKP